MNTNHKPVAAGKEQQDDAASVIAYRKRCDADGVGLSHYILMDKAPAGAAVIARRKRCSADGVGLSHYILMDKEQKA
ncbi:MAG TPA: modified peptide precursor CbpA [Sedimenticola sp.]|nr:modified peptide precursor CbpA [Sedimenticola sp.]